MTIKEALNTIEHVELYVYAIEGTEYKTLAMPSVSNGIKEYSEECKKLRALAEADEYTVRRIGLCERGARENAFIYIECEKK